MSARTQPLRLVIDTQTWLDLLWFHDERTTALHAAMDEHRLEIAHDAYGLAEWMRLLDYPGLGIDVATRARLIMQFKRQSRMFSAPQAYIKPPRAPLPRCRDPDDQPFLQLAQDSAAQFLVSRDKALLALDHRCRRQAGFAVVSADSGELRAALG